MRRRRVLASVGTALASGSAGCLDGMLGGSPAGRHVSLTDIGAVDSDHPFAFAAALRSRALGPGSAPELEITLRSTADEELLLRYAESWPADGLVPDRDSAPGGLRLLTTGEFSDLTVESGNCPLTEYRPITTESDGRGHVRPETEVRQGFRAVGSAEALAGACPESGRYRFLSAYAYKRADEVERVGFEAAEQRQFSWGFTIEIPGTA